MSRVKAAGATTAAQGAEPRSKQLRGYVLLSGLSLLSGACTLFGGVSVESSAVAVRRPSNIALHVTVADGDEPVENLSAKNFRIYEDDQLIEAEQSRLTLLAPEVAIAREVVLLIDTSGTSGGRDHVVQGAEAFVQAVREKVPVSVYGYAGTGRLELVRVLKKSAGEGRPDLNRLRRPSADPSRALRASVQQGLRQLDARLAVGGRGLRFGALVVFARGADLTGREPSGDLEAELEQTPHAVFGVGIEGKTDTGELDELAPSGVVLAPSEATLPRAFQEIADRVLAEFAGSYLVSYCSPARAGTRTLRLEIEWTNAEGEQKSGSLEEDFDASGFTSGCNPSSPPRFQRRKANGAARKRSNTEGPAQEERIVPPPDQPGYTH